MTTTLLLYHHQSIPRKHRLKAHTNLVSVEGFQAASIHPIANPLETSTTFSSSLSAPDHPISLVVATQSKPFQDSSTHARQAVSSRSRSSTRSALPYRSSPGLATSARRLLLSRSRSKLSPQSGIKLDPAKIPAPVDSLHSHA